MKAFYASPLQAVDEHAYSPSTGLSGNFLEENGIVIV